MKFLGKKEESQILQENMKYKVTGGNNRLLDLLLDEQHQFCAYTEEKKKGTDSFEVEHFNSSLKPHDDYYNYYAVKRFANLKKKDEKYRGTTTFFTSLFYRSSEELKARIRFIENKFEEVNAEDKEAIDFIDFLDLNHPDLYDDRRKHVNRVKKTLADSGYSTDEQKLEYFRNYPTELSFVTALESEFGLNLSEFYT